jgi:RNA polymerase sigma-70 factor (ECF subfamily)
MKSEKVYIEYLILQAQAGDAQAGDDLMAVLNAKIKAFVLKILGGSAAVDDCVQDSLLKIYQGINQLRQVKAVHTWIFRIVHSICMDHIRKNPTAVNEIVEDSEDLSDLEQQLDIKSAIATLSEAQQAIIYLFYYEGFNVMEVAEILTKPAGTVKYLLFTAREQIKSKITI